MSEFPSYADIADRTLGDVTEPKIIPSGTWEGEIIGGKAQKARSENQPHRAYFPVKLTRPTDNVSMAMLDDFGDTDLANADIGWEYPFWRESSVQHLKRTLVGLGVVGDENEPLSAFYKASAGTPIMFDVVHEGSDENGIPYTKIKNVRAMNNVG